MWHDGLPAWVGAGGFTPIELRDILFEHIDNVSARYRGQVYCWDVVNEAFNPADGTLRSSVWYDTPGIGFAGMGTRYIEECFRRARIADTNAELFYNDFSNEVVNAKSNAIHAMCQDFVARGVPIDGIGFQMHVPESGVDLASFRSNLQRFSDLGLNLHITELDVRLPVDANGNASAAALANQAEVYLNVLGVALGNPRVRAVVTWGFTDAHSWISGAFPGFGAPLPFDRTYGKKPAYWAIWNAFANQAEKLPVPTASDAVSIVADPAAKAGAVRRFTADATGDTATFTVQVPHPGVWNVRLGLLRRPDAGQFQLAVAPLGGFSNVGAVLEGYEASTAPVDLKLGDLFFSAAGGASFRVTVSGKAAASTGHAVHLDYVRLTPVGLSTNAAPTIGTIVDQAVLANAPTAPIAFTVSDAETPVASLTVTAHSLNPAVLPQASLTVGGSGANRTLTISPAATLGTAAVVVKVSDDSQEVAETLLVTVGDSDLATNGGFELGNTTGWSTVGAGLSLTVINTPVQTGTFASKLSGRTQAFHGVGQSFLTRMANGTTYYVSGWARVANAASANVKITARIGDGGSPSRFEQIASVTANNTGWVRLANFFTLTHTGTLNDLFIYFEGLPAGVELLVDTFRVEANTPPALSVISDRTIAKNTSTGAVAFTVNDAQTGTTGVTVTAASSNTAVVPNSNVLLGGSGADRTVNVTPLANATGQTIITITASDGRISASRSFVVRVESSLEQWRFLHFGTTSATGLAANDADAEADGMSNVLESYLALNPRAATRNDLPQLAREGTDLTLTYTRAKAALTETTHVVESSSNLASWSTAGVVESILSDDGSVQRVKARVPINSAGVKFMRLQVSQPKPARSAAASDLSAAVPS